MKAGVTKGFVLLTVLFFLQLLAFMSLQSLMNISLTTRINGDAWLHELNLRTAGKILREVESNFLQREHCSIPVTPAEELAKNPLSWWMAHSCSGNLAGIQYHYVVEFLGEAICTLIRKNENNHLVMAEYYRITLLYWPERDREAAILLQSTWVRAGREASPCQPYHLVLSGRQMWRQIR
ncbi:hypothetical protein [Aquicella lusitana]|uniref:Tfp pilus assembly protein PilX n=1 Tax=Aquicella lusitana TaxID=254246 RepID=A0A370GYU5_9COXI|nr:hypothetical protein [Aquicella lusitana]RDI48812.1 hypothetical protein C8D86_10191 [Aquicella lusitana]VVC73240.1 hypothetical protein AQULUS_09720 [Aquicella lusitana]